ncbi:uncharacterized protein A1O9_02163 [Exophiala aquamarina CBS 119918]|uniref:SUN-like protein 1 n=1 Tax=Exophiala aquamarina CBS 119918 TaxID=1182545 RepID=A0A072PLH0_9EURO|nr:uncharacterized protein A1O9_02163 [Exophiala aquamarina CBS 119918]KEF60602.1 hypothetical protein A1O9_02163 [Exophiala aquamarina CBS 119918]
MKGFSTILLTLNILLAPVLAASTPASALTCPYRTVNYITHTLPQQCLTSSRKASPITSLTTAGNSTTGSAGSSTSTGVQLSNVDSENANVSTVAAASPVTVNNTSIQPQSTAVTASSEPYISGTDDAIDEVSPLEDVKFLSFEDWKRENLKKSGQSEHIGQRARGEPQKRPIIDQNSLDSLGDDAEIDLDFSGFVSDGLEPENQPQPRPPQPVSDGTPALEPGRTPRVGLRSKDAGKTCKERSNYASFDCGANIIKTNPEAKSPFAILGKNKDAYMLNECSAQNKYVILELCDDIAVDTIVVANFEFFSSIFRAFKVSVSDKYPVKPDKWKTLGTFEARNSREVQAFLVENSVIWARYLRIEFLTHYGSEYYCPLSLVRVHGTTMLEEYKHDLESLQNEEEDEPVLVLEEQSTLTDGQASDAVTGATTSQTDSHRSETANLREDMTVSQDLQPSSANETISNHGSVEPASEVATSSTNLSTIMDSLGHQRYATETCDLAETSLAIEPEGRIGISMTDSISIGSSTSSSTSSLGSSNSIRTQAPMTESSNITSPSSSSPNVSSQAANSTSSKGSSIAPSFNSTKVQPSQTQAAPAAPTMQESFFKSVQKRLQMLESNSSLSLQYIEEQSRALRDAFQKVEQRQLAKTTSFLDYLNNTVLNELREFRLQYDQLWQSTVIELELQRERYQHENLAINARLGVVADELIFQKRMSTLQMILILVCLGLVLFSKGSLNSYLELPLFQNVLSRSPSTRWLNIPTLETPTQSPPVTRTNSVRSSKRQGILKGHRRLSSEDSVESTLSPADLYTPSTPVSFGETSDDEREHENNDPLGNPQFDPSLIERPSTSPPVLLGRDMASTPPTPISLTDAGARTIETTLETCSPQSGVRPPLLLVEDATPPAKHLTWQLPDD